MSEVPLHPPSHCEVRLRDVSSGGLALENPLGLDRHAACRARLPARGKNTVKSQWGYNSV